MNIPVIISGACGRMGTTLIRQVQNDSACTLVGLLEHKDCKATMTHAPCSFSTCAEELLQEHKGATIIDFTSPDASVPLAEIAAKYGNPMVIGTTGLSQAQQDSLNKSAEKTCIAWGPNMSIGVNVLYKILPQLVKMLGEDYDIEMVELHHSRKKDSPSGTALKLAEYLAQARDWDLPEVANYHREGIIGERPKNEIGIQTIRGGDVVGVHTMYFLGDGERIEISHQAHSRQTFAAGAIRVAKWLAGQKPGRLYTLQDIF